MRALLWRQLRLDMPATQVEMLLGPPDRIHWDRDVFGERDPRQPLTQYYHLAVYVDGGVCGTVAYRGGGILTRDAGLPDKRWPPTMRVVQPDPVVIWWTAPANGPPE